MGNKETKLNTEIQSFFEENKVTLSSNVSTDILRDKIRDQVLQQYIIHQQTNTMEDTLPGKVPFWKQKTFLKFSGAFVVVAIATAAIIGGLTFYKASPQTIKAEIAYTEGKVYYKSATSGWSEAKNDTILQEGYSLKVEGAGKAIANIDDGSAIRLNSNTIVTLTSMASGHIIINNDKGEVYSRVAKADRLFDVVANGVIYRSMGTAYKTTCIDEEVDGKPLEKVESDKVIINGVEVYQSKVQILGVDENTIIVQQGEKYYVVSLDAELEEDKVIEVSKSDLEEDEFVMWNKDQDEMVREFKDQMGVLFDIEIPDLAVTSPASEDTTVNTPTVTVSGTTEANLKITVNDVAIINDNGSFSYVYNLVAGYNGIKLIVEDEAGNKAVRNFRVNYVSATEPTPVTTDKPAATAKPGITLTGTKVSNGISFTWNVVGLDVSKGFKLVRSTSDNPVYPGNDYQYLTNSTQRSYTWSIKDGVTYKFRVCQYDGNGHCLVYSNQVTVQAPAGVVEPTTAPAAGLNLTIKSSNSVAWTVASGVSKNGYKVVWSKTSGPTYPTRGTDQYQYFSDSARRTSDALDAFDGYGVYYVRVCAYGNGPSGECSPYSNQVTLTLGTAPTATPTVAVPTSTPTP